MLLQPNQLQSNEYHELKDPQCSKFRRRISHTSIYLDYFNRINLILLLAFFSWSWLPCLRS